MYKAVSGRGLPVSWAITCSSSHHQFIALLWAVPSFLKRNPRKFLYWVESNQATLCDFFTPSKRGPPWKLGDLSAPVSQGLRLQACVVYECLRMDLLHIGVCAGAQVCKTSMKVKGQPWVPFLRTGYLTFFFFFFRRISPWPEAGQVG